MKRLCLLMTIAVLIVAMAAIQGCGGESTTAPTSEAAPAVTLEPLRSANESQVSESRESEETGTSTTNASGSESTTAPTEEPAPAVTREPLRSANESQASGIQESEETGTSMTSTSGTGGTSDDSSGASTGEPESSPLPIMEGVSPAFVQDGQMYAEQFGVSLEEAVSRLMLQEPIGELGAAIEANESDTFAGLWIQHEPRYAVVVMFTRDGEQTISKYVQEGPLEELIEVRHGEATLEELRKAQADANKIVRDLGYSVASGINVFENRAELYTSDRTALEAALSENGRTLPDHVKILGP